MSETGYVFRAFWPVLDEGVPFQDLQHLAAGELTGLVAAAGAQLVTDAAGRGGRWRVIPSRLVPGSGDVAERVLLFECPARRVAVRAYRSGAAA